MLKPTPGTRWPRVLADGRTAVIPRFTYTTQNEADPAMSVSMEVAIDDGGRPACLELSVRPLDGKPVTSQTLRAIPVQRLLRQAAVQASTFLAYGGATADGGSRFEAPSAIERGRIATRALSAARSPRQGSPITSDHLKQVADIYRAALAAGERPTRAICERWHVTRPTASRWVAAARAAELLGPAKQGRASA